MTDYRKRLERYIAGDYVAEIWPEDTFGDVKPSDNVKADLRKLLAEGDRMRELVADLERRAEACERLEGQFHNGPSRDRLAGKVQAYRHAADVARQALGDLDQ